MHSFGGFPLWVSVRKDLQSDAALELMMRQRPRPHLLLLTSELSESPKLAEPTMGPSSERPARPLRGGPKATARLPPLLILLLF